MKDDVKREMDAADIEQLQTMKSQLSDSASQLKSSLDKNVLDTDKVAKSNSQTPEQAAIDSVKSSELNNER